ncbi:MAG: hypothetical protein ABT15_03065 [Pseudonocardia sp. SCN 73-27]|nr:MAG: hypothetical protein ABS80_20310 [Pseudonocardia sp. SCN 72-51]ODV08798.1 MAG: hypothetical protein ABT15_03065 [Pseudonocardia sp. SCN 73-27]
MAGDGMTAATVDPVDAHVDALGAMLRGPARLRASMLAEARDGLEDAAESLCGTGVEPREARSRAVADFGAVDEIAPRYQEELAAAQSRRTATLIAVTFPALILVWTLLKQDSPGSPVELTLLFHVEAVTTVVAAILALATLLAVRRAHPARALRAITLVGTLAPLVCVVTGLTMALLGPSHGSAHLPAAYAATAVVLVALIRSVGRAHRVLVRTRRIPCER